MKQIISTQPEDTLPITPFLNQETDKFYGVLDNPGNIRGFITREITRETYRQGNFMLMAARNLTGGNGWVFSDINRDFSTLYKIVSFIMSRGFKVYQFDSFKELMDWVSEGNCE